MADQVLLSQREFMRGRLFNHWASPTRYPFFKTYSKAPFLYGLTFTHPNRVATGYASAVAWSRATSN
jgi:hypothetical protein